MSTRAHAVALAVLLLVPLKGWAPTEELFGNFHFKVETDRNLQGLYRIELRGSRTENTQFIWSVDAESKASVVLSPKSQPVVTEKPFLDVVLSNPGAVNLQVLFTSPGERVVGTAGRVMLGARDSNPKPGMTAYFALPEVGDEVLVAFNTAKGGGRLSFTTDFGDGGKPVIGAPAQYQYGKPGPYRITTTASDKRGRTASAFLDIEVSPFPALANPCTRIPGAPSAYRCANTENYAVCMIFLREANGDFTCEDMSNPLNNADKLAGGAPAFMQSCSLSPDFPAGGWRCFTDPALTQCRRYLVGHQHLPADTVRQCQFEDQPDKISKVIPATIDGTIDPNATYGVSFTVNDGRVDITYNNPGPLPLNHQCSENIANHFGGTCNRYCDQSYYTVKMDPLDLEVPVIKGLSCSDPFDIGTLIGIGDATPRAAETCKSLLQSSPTGSKVSFTTTVWMTATGHYLWNFPATGGNANERWYSNEFKDSPTTPTPVAIPALVNCSN